jgi:hypothetical protein
VPRRFDRFTKAPASIKRFNVALCPCCAAKYKGVTPFLFALLTLQPASIKAFKIVKRPADLSEQGSFNRRFGGRESARRVRLGALRHRRTNGANSEVEAELQVELQPQIEVRLELQLQSSSLTLKFNFGFTPK